MAKCLNCEDNAVFLVQNQGALPQEFCDAHLPKMFNKLSLPSVVKKLDAPTTPYAALAAAEAAEVEIVREKARAKKKAAVSEEPVVEESTEEETPAE
jgi:hypothetical protein